MMQLANNSPIYPLKEILAYEALWANKKTTFKSLADLFRGHPRSRPSDFVDLNAIPVLIEAIRRQVLSIRDSLNLIIDGTLNYPERLKDAKEPLELLYYTGNLDFPKTRSIAIVGARKASTHGLSIASQLATRLAKDDITVVSGLAAGIDTQAHESAIAAGGRTVGVIGTPLNMAYPKQNSNLQEKIAKEHLLISQVPFYRYSIQDYRINKQFFLERNKTMSALTEATIIVEASDTSGSLTQALAAVHQGRQLFIWEACFNNPEVTWPEKFAKKGAKKISNYEELRSELNIIYGESGNN